MFATLLGALPRPIEQETDVDRLVEAAVGAQEEAGLEPITDGRVGATFERVATPDEVVARWRSTQALTGRAVKQALPGPFSAGLDAEGLSRLAGVVAALAGAGCPLVEIEETATERLRDARELRRFRDAHEQLLRGASGTHMSLSIVGGSVEESAWATVIDLPYASLAVDLIAGSENWNLVTRLAGDRGVIAGVESAREPDEPKEVLLWAAHYAASTKGRGRNRVGLGSAGSWANLAWVAAVRKMQLLGETARLGAMPPSPELAASLNPQAVSARSAGLGTTRRRAR